MFNLKPSCNHVRSLCVPLVAWMAMEVSLAQSNPTEQIASFNPPYLDTKLFFALGMIESGNDDRGIGSAGEVSRYQIHPVVWRNYSQSRAYQNPEISLQVARRHWDYLTNYFRGKTGREPTSFDMYVMWNTRFGYYARKGFDRVRLPPVVQDRARRFVNLLNR